MNVTVKSSMPTGKEDPKFGAEYYVNFNEIPDAVPFWFKKQPETDQPMEIEQVNGKWKKVKKEWPTSAPTANTPGNQPAQSTVKPPYKDNTDGIKQGMWINNAAAFVNNQVHDKVPTPEEWATKVHEYASAGYSKGDLNAPKPSTVAEMFGSEPVPVNG